MSGQYSFTVSRENITKIISNKLIQAENLSVNGDYITAHLENFAFSSIKNS